MTTEVAKSFTVEVSFFTFSYFLMLGRGRIKEANYLEESPRVIYGENQNWSPTFTLAQIYGTQTLTNKLYEGKDGFLRTYQDFCQEQGVLSILKRDNAKTCAQRK